MELLTDSIESKYTPEEVEYMKLIHFTVNKNYTYTQSCLITKEDMISVCSVGMVKALNHFDESQGTKFSTYAIFIMEQELRLYYRYMNSNKRIVLRHSISYDRKISYLDEDDKLKYSDMLKQEDNVLPNILEQEWYKNLYQLIPLLPLKERVSVILYHGLYDIENETQSEIGSMLGLTQSYVQRILKRAYKRIRKELEEYDNQS